MNFRHLNRLEKTKQDPHKLEQERRAKEAKEARELLELELELYELEKEEAFKARQKKEAEERRLEQEMREALGLPEDKPEDKQPAPKPVTEKPKKAAAPLTPKPQVSAYRPPQITVRIGVQAGGVGPVRSYTHVYKGFNIFEAREEARKAAREEGLHFCWYIEEIRSE